MADHNKMKIKEELLDSPSTAAAAQTAAPDSAAGSHLLGLVKAEPGANAEAAGATAGAGCKRASDLADDDCCSAAAAAADAAASSAPTEDDDYTAFADKLQEFASQATQLPPPQAPVVVQVEYAAVKSMDKTSKTPAGARWLWEFVSKMQIDEQGRFRMTGDKYQRAFDYDKGDWSGARNPCDFLEASLADKDEEAAHSERMAQAKAHFEEKGRRWAHRGTSFNGKWYRGMPVGCSHSWSYADAPFALGLAAQNVRWTETKVGADRWALDVVGQLVRPQEQAQPSSDGDDKKAATLAAATAMPVGCYLLLGNQVATRLEEKKNTYFVHLRGGMHYLGPDYNKERRDMLLGLQLTRLRAFAALAEAAQAAKTGKRAQKARSVKRPAKMLSADGENAAGGATAAAAAAAAKEMEVDITTMLFLRKQQQAEEDIRAAAGQNAAAASNFLTKFAFSQATAPRTSCAMTVLAAKQLEGSSCHNSGSGSGSLCGSVEV